jgi:ATP-dependent DNA helicase DinG
VYTTAVELATLKAASTLKFYQQLLGPSGLVAGKVEGFSPRVQQIEMAAMIADAIATNQNALIEAGTGTGKTFAYLLPVLHSRQRVIVTTGSKTLQDQLFYDDIPLIVSLLDWPVKTALLKGRNNYLCPQRLEQHISMMSRRSDASVLSDLVAVREWWQQTTTGDLTELADLEGAAFVPLITSTVDNCLGAVCPHVAACPLYLARARAQEADLVVINHHLLFADLALKEEGFASLLPDVETIVVDEAHQIVDVARHFFGERVSSQQVVALCRDVRAELQVFGNDDSALASATDNLAEIMGLLVRQFDRMPAGLPLDELLGLDTMADLIDQVDLAFGALSATLAQAAVRSINFSHCYSRVNRLADHFALLTEMAPVDDNCIHWIERQTSGFTLHLSPVSIASAMQAHLDSDRTWVMTSATLSVARQFSHFKRYLGIAAINERIFDSPFNFVEQAKAHIPAGLPLPGTDQHTRMLINYCLPMIRGHNGRTFFLFTSYRALHIARDIFEGYSDLPTLVQGSMAKPKLLARFREIPGCILLATNSFWEGVDVRGADLKCLIIDKLPFSSPDNPMTAAQLRAITAGGGNAFLEHAVPEAAIALKQGFGRLIRQESDRGLFILGDSRMRTRTYGKLFVDSLPAMEWLECQEQAVDYLEILSL